MSEQTVWTCRTSGLWEDQWRLTAKNGQIEVYSLFDGRGGLRESVDALERAIARRKFAHNGWAAILVEAYGGAA